MSCSAPYKVFANSEPMKVFSGGVGAAKVFATGGVQCAMDNTPNPGLPTSANYMTSALPYASACRNTGNGELVCKK